MPNSLSEKEKKYLLKNAHSALILSLGDKVLIEISKEKTAAAVWLKLENLYMTVISEKIVLEAEALYVQDGFWKIP